MLRFILLVVGCDAARKNREASDLEMASMEGDRMTIANLYTFGAPKMATGGGLADPLSSDGCFSGLRIVNKEKGGVVDMVPTLLRAVPGYRHTKAEAVFVYNSGKIENQTCGWMGYWPNVPYWGLHDADMYRRWTANALPALKPMVSVVMPVLHETDWNKAARFVASQGYGLVASAVYLRLDEVAHLIQNPNTLDCWLSFEGSDNGEDWWNNIQVWTSRFCGLQQKVHTGFKKSTMGIVEEWSFQAYIRPNLGYCKSIDVMGHSLGGSIGGLFNACAHSKVKPGQQGYEEFQKIRIEKKEPKRMPYIVEP